jgi:hypothetical protein
MRALGVQGTLVELPPDIGKLRDMQTLILSGWFVLACRIYEWVIFWHLLLVFAFAVVLAFRSAGVCFQNSGLSDVFIICTLGVLLSC